MKRLLKKYKDKLYTFLVLKNSAIASEYQSYVMADVQRHEKHKVKSWIFLIKLNIKYRIFRTKSPLVARKRNDRKPYSFGSESGILNRPLPIHLAMKLMQYDIISFDIFDTLLLRIVSNPTDVFVFLSNKNLWLKFKQHRIKAEADARRINYENYGTREISIAEIYKEVNSLTGIDIDYGITEELQMEMKLCYANSYMVEVIRFLREHNKKIVCTSDMYWPKKYLLQLLKHCGYNDFDDIFVSCEYGVSKHEGKLFEYVKEKYGKDLKYIHIGDNYKADILGAEAANIDSVYYKGINEIGKPYRPLGISTIFSSIYDGLVNSRLHKDEKIYSPQYEFGYLYGGFYIFGFVNYIIEQCKLINSDRVLFIARDGDIYQQVFKIMNTDIESKYLLWSRICNIVYAIDFDRNFFLMRVCRMQTGEERSFMDILESFDIAFLTKRLASYGLSQETILDNDNVEVFYNFLLENIVEIENQYKKTRDALKEYFKFLIGDSKKITLVDVGWMGTAPIVIKKLIRDIWQLDVDVEIILAASHHYSKDGGVDSHINRYLFSEFGGRYHQMVHGAYHTSVFELFTQSCSPSFGALKMDNDNTVKFIFQSPDIENYQITKEIHKGIIDFVQDYKNKLSEFPYMYKVSGQDAYTPFRHLMSNQDAVNNAVGDAIQQIQMAGIYNTKCSGYKTIKDLK